MKENEEDISEKQIFLRKNILDKGYNADEFMQYLSQLKGEEGLDLSNWSLDELSTTVKDFIAQKNSNSSDSNNQKEKKGGNILSKINSIVSSELNLDNNIYDNNKDDNNKDNNKKLDAINQQYIKEQMKMLQSNADDFIYCTQTEFTPISEQSGLNITLTFPEKVAGGIFSKSYISYLMETNPLGFRVRKRYSDFEWLYNILGTIYVGCVIPPLCKKNYGDRFTENLIFKRTRLFQKFMEGILVHPLLRNSQIIYDFISIDKEEDFEAKKKNYNKIKSPMTLKDIKTLDGKMNVAISKEKEIYLENIKDICDINETVIKKITQNYKQLTELMKQVSEKLKETGELWKIMYDHSKKYYDTNNTCESYNLMSSLMDCLSDIENKKIELMNKNIREYFRFVKNEFHSLKDLSIKVEGKKDVYSKEYDKLYKIKESLFKSQDINKWGIIDKNDLQHKVVLLKNKNIAFSKMLPAESKKLRKIREIYGYYLNSFISEYERLRLLNSRRHKDHVCRFSKLIADIMIQFHKILNEQIKFFEKLKDEEDTAAGTKKIEGYSLF